MRVVSRGYAGSLAGLGQWREHGVGRVWVWRGSQGGDIMAQVTTPRPQVLRWANSSQLRRAGGGKLLWKGKMAGWEKIFGLVWTGSRDTIMQQQGRKNKQAGRQAGGRRSCGTSLVTSYSIWTRSAPHPLLVPFAQLCF